MDIASLGSTVDGSTSLAASDDSRVSSGNSASAAGSVPTDSLADKQAFLQLLIAQIKHQDPLNPTDGIEFLSQLAQFSELEQLIGIRNDIQAIGDLAALQAAGPVTDLSNQTTDHVVDKG